jgi:hypothetical protein
VFGYQFAPRYRDIQEKVRTASMASSTDAVRDDPARPRRKIGPQLIVEEWEHRQRIFVSLARKTTTQHIIVGKLSA